MTGIVTPPIRIEADCHDSAYPHKKSLSVPAMAAKPAKMDVPRRK
jgi:hypothetical protein